jgi:hypothetical protein
MRFRELETVVLERDIPEHGLRKGDLGAVVVSIARPKKNPIRIGSRADMARHARKY